MKKITIIGATDFERRQNPMDRTHDILVTGPEEMLVSDGYHSFDELYEHRITLFIALCRQLVIHADNSPVWKSKLHSDGSSFEGWFILGINKEKDEQITYHLPMSKWELTEFAQELEKAPEWDGHKPEDVLKRLSEI